MPPSLSSPLRILAGLALAVACSTAASGLGGCANASHVVLAQEQKLGLDGGISGTGPGVLRASLGYHRRAAVIIPKVDVSGETRGSQGEPADGKHPYYEAASVAAFSAATFHGLRAPEVEQVVMTGRAAVLAAAGTDPFPTTKPTPPPTPTPAPKPTTPSTGASTPNSESGSSATRQGE